MYALQLFLSDEAYQGLAEQAREAAYTRSEERVRGLSKFMVTLINANPTSNLWLDKRPQSIKEVTLEELEGGLFPTWDKGDRRYPRPLGLPPGFSARCSNLAKELGVIKSNAPGTRGRGDRLTPRALTSEFWEAVGIGWLQPTNIPMGVFKTIPRRKKEDLVW